MLMPSRRTSGDCETSMFSAVDEESGLKFVFRALQKDNTGVAVLYNAIRELVYG